MWGSGIWGGGRFGREKKGTKPEECGEEERGGLERRDGAEEVGGGRQRGEHWGYSWWGSWGRFGKGAVLSGEGGVLASKELFGI